MTMQFQLRKFRTQINSHQISFGLNLLIYKQAGARTSERESDEELSSEVATQYSHYAGGSLALIYQSWSAVLTWGDVEKHKTQRETEKLRGAQNYLRRVSGEWRT